MKVTKTNGEAFEILSMLAKSAETGKLGFALAKQRRYLETELTEFIDIRNEIIQRHTADDGKIYPDQVRDANDELREYVDIPCSFEVVHVDEDTFTSGNLTAADMFKLYFMTEEENEDAQIPRCSK